MKIALIDTFDPAIEPIALSAGIRDHFSEVIELKKMHLEYSSEVAGPSASGHSYLEWFERIDEWATTIADSLLIDDVPLTMPEREAFRLRILDRFDKEFNMVSGTLKSRFADRLTPGDDVVVFSTREFLKLGIKLFLRPSGVFVTSAPRDSTRKPARSDAGHASAVSSPALPQDFTLKTKVKKWMYDHRHFQGILRVAVWRYAMYEAISRHIRKIRLLPPKWTQINQCRRYRSLARRIRRSRRPVIEVFLHHPQAYKIIVRTLDLLSNKQYAVLLVADYQQSTEWDVNAPYPVIEFSCFSSGVPPLKPKRVRVKHVEANGTSFDLGDMTAELENCVNQMCRSREQEVEMHQALWRCVSPAVVVACDTLSVVPLAARRNGIRSVSVAHADMVPSFRAYGFDAVALFGQEDMLSHYQRENPPAECRLYPIGACQFDRIFRREFPGEQDIRGQLCVAPSVPIICFASWWNPPGLFDVYKRKLLDWIVKAMPANTMLVIKKHPLETDTICEEAMSSLDVSRYRIVRDMDLHGLFNVMSALVVLTSASASEAIMLKKPVIVIDNPEVHIMRYFKYGLVRLVRDADELKAAFEDILRGDSAFIPDYDIKREAFIRNCYYSDDGNASERLADLILGLATQTIAT